MGTARYAFRVRGSTSDAVLTAVQEGLRAEVDPTTTLWPRSRKRRNVSGDTPVSTRSISGRHWWWTRGAATASARFMPKSMLLTITCSTVEMMRLPPGLPGQRAQGLHLLERARLGGKIVHLVVKQDAGALGDKAEAIGEI